MNSFLLDTCIFLWLTLDPSKLSPQVRDICSDGNNELYLSAVSVWEITLKYRIGKLNLNISPDRFVTQQRAAHDIEELPFRENEALQQLNLPFHHKDPFDRMLVAQAVEHDVPILTPDSYIAQYAIKSIW